MLFLNYEKNNRFRRKTVNQSRYGLFLENFSQL
jgi:hypothetical protein